MDKLLATRQEAARALSISVRSVDFLIETGQLASRKLGRRRLVPLAALEAFARRDHARITPAQSEAEK
jgi:excisionase family DNA binding protein